MRKSLTDITFIFESSHPFSTMGLFLFATALSYYLNKFVKHIILRYSWMGQEQPQGPKVPEKTLKEQVKEYTKEINQMRREYNREKIKLEYQGKTLQKDLKRKIEKKQPAQSQKVIAQQMLKNNQMVNKYNTLDAQLQNVTFELQQMCVNESMQNVMSGMAKIMSGANNKMKGMDYQDTMKRFMTEKERMNVMNEYVQDIMGGEQEEIEDEDVDKLIGEMTAEQVAKHKKKVEMNLDEYEDNLNDL